MNAPPVDRDSGEIVAREGICRSRARQIPYGAQQHDVTVPPHHSLTPASGERDFIFLGALRGNWRWPRQRYAQLAAVADNTGASSDQYTHRRRRAPTCRPQATLDSLRTGLMVTKSLRGQTPRKLKSTYRPGSPNASLTRRGSKSERMGRRDAVFSATRAAQPQECPAPPAHKRARSAARQSRPAAAR